MMYDYMAFLRINGSDEQLESARRMILDFKDNIPGVVYVSVGVDVRTDQTYNWGVYIRFEDASAREAYKTNALHSEVGKKFGPLVEGPIQIVEFEVS
jgi:hypothetical protein